METLLRLDVARTALEEGTGKGIKVALLDSGINFLHPALQDCRIVDDLHLSENEGKFQFIASDGKDASGHGTAQAILMRRIAPEVELGSIRVLDEHLQSRTALICAGAKEALRRGYHLLHCSFGCAVAEHLPFYKEWVDDAYYKGVHVVTACDNEDPHRPELPGYFPTVCNVDCAVTENRFQFFYHPGERVEFSTQGVEMEIPWHGGEIKKVTGSSYAAAHFSGLLARLLSKTGALSPSEVKAVMQRLGTAAAMEKK